MDTIKLLERAAAEFRSRLEKVTDWTVDTPCTEWDARALSNHVVNEIMWIPPLVEGKTIAEVGPSLDGDLLGDDAVAAWDAATERVLSILSQPGALERPVQLSYGERDTAGYVTEVTADITVHTWDLARAVGADERLDPVLVDLATGYLTPVIEGAREAGVFAAAVLVPDDADPQTKLIALTGRTP
ncbi:MAG TPA: TIGR03086 family metal-binding protein [Actinomycetota bacterium]|nr:TIGR03086 family metal-binding protein [Actinomycetota bacterium]